MSTQRVFILEKKFYCHPVFTNYAASKDGEIANVKTKRKLKMQDNGNGYCKFIIYDKHLIKCKNYYQHRFVYECFNGLIPKGFHCDHINRIRSDNRINI